MKAKRQSCLHSTGFTGSAFLLAWYQLTIWCSVQGCFSLIQCCMRSPAHTDAS